METLTKIETTKKEEDDSKEKESKKVITKSKISIKRDPKLRMSYIVPEEIYPENIDLWPLPGFPYNFTHIFS